MTGNLTKLLVFLLLSANLNADDKNASKVTKPSIIVRIGSNRWEHGGWVNGLALSHDGRLAASTGLFTARVVEVPEGTVLFEMPTSNAFVRALLFGHEGSTLFDGGARESHVSLWNVKTRKVEREIRIHPKYRANALSLALSPDGRILAVSYDYYPRISIVSTGVAVFDIATGRSLYQHDDWWQKTDFQFKLNGDRYEGTFDQGQLSIQVETSKLTAEQRVNGFLPLADRKGRLKYKIQLDNKRGLPGSHLKQGKGIHQNQAIEKLTASAVSADGSRRITGGTLGTVHVWDLKTGEPLDPPRPNLWSVDAAFSQDGRFILTTPADETSTAEPIIWNAETGRKVNDVDVLPLKFSPDAAHLKIETQWESISLFERTSDTKLRDFSFLPENAKRGTSFVPHLRQARISPDGKSIVGAGKFIHHLELPKEELGPRVHIWEAETGRTIGIYIEKQRSIETPLVEFSPDSQLLGVGMQDVLRLLDPSNGTVMKTLNGHNGAIRSLAFSPDCKRLATAADDNTVVIWDLESVKTKD